MSSETYHEPYEKLTPVTVELHRALQSLQEELEAVDWYQQRIDASGDAELKAILAHNRDEEKEHAAMVLEWIRRRDPGFAAALKTYLFTQGDVTTIEEEVEEKGASPKAGEAASSPAREPGEGASAMREPAQERPVLTVGALRTRK